jgi:ribonuclease P protein component
MFKKIYRLNTSEFKEVFTLGNTTHTPLFLIKTKKNNLTHPRFAIVVSKKISKKAVERNYLKRRFMYKIKDMIGMFLNNDYIFILNSTIKDIQYKDLLNNFKI